MIINKEILDIDFEKFSNEWVDTAEYNSFLYDYFNNQVSSIELLSNHFQVVSNYQLGYGERAFRYFWLLIFNKLSDNSKFLEIGVFKGSILALSQLCANNLEKTIECWGVTPLGPVGDKYSEYVDDDYDNSISFLYNQLELKRDNTTIIKGLSTDQDVKSKVINEGAYDVVYIDGGHDYETVINDIQLANSVLKTGGLLVMDDASYYLNFSPNHKGFRGHEDVSKAIKDDLDNRINYTHLFACGHNRVWKKLN